MGGRGAWADRRRAGNFSTTRTDNRNASGGGTTATRNTTVTSGGGTDVIDGVTFSGSSDAQIASALGSQFNRQTMADILALPSGASVNITSYSGHAEATISYKNVQDGVNKGFTATYKFDTNSDGVTFSGSRLFSNDRGYTRANENDATNASNGAGVRSLIKGLRNGVNRGLITEIRVPQAIGSAGDRSSQGSNLWAKMGIDKPLANIYGLPARPANLSGARSVSDLMLSKEGRAWWASNRREFGGSVNLRDKSSSSYKVASRFLRLGRA